MILYSLFSNMFFINPNLPALSFLLVALSTEAPASINTLIVPVIVIIVLILLNGLFVGAEFAIIGVRPTQIEHRAKEGNRLAKSVLAILRSSDRQNRYIATAQLGITIASLGLGMYGEQQIADFVEPHLALVLGIDPHETIIVTIGSLIAISLLTYLHIVIGEMVPKSLALNAPVKAVLALTEPMRLMEGIFRGPVLILNSIGDVLLYLFRIPFSESRGRLHSSEELELIVSESAEGGFLNQAEEEMIRNIFDFADRQVHQVMTPRPRVEAIPSNISLPDLLKLVANSNFSRFPIYEGDLDHIVGILHLKDLIRHQLRQKGTFDIRLVLRPALVVPEHYPADKLLTVCKRRRIHIAVVLDEFGGTAGIVTLEDLVEEIVGEVRDEFDRETEPILELAPGRLEVAGDYLLDDLAEMVDLGKEDNLPNIETIGGLIMTKLGRVPQAGDTVSFNDQIQFTVLAVDGMAVARVMIEFPPSKAQEAAKNEQPPVPPT
jgi:CBS domain containing-hemolysin-like protein